MSILETLRVDLKSLDEGSTKMRFDLSDDYFNAIEEEEVSGGEVFVDVNFRRTQDLFTVDFHSEGTVKVTCDRCLDEMEQEIEADNRLIIKLGDMPAAASRSETQYSDDGETMTVDKNSGIADLSWFIYESIALSIPVKHVHAPGKCNVAMIETLESHKNGNQSAARSSEDEDETIDPRWNALKNIKFEN
jgi:uncharacterized metal-binding protein YceD (DUF177 family)